MTVSESDRTAAAATKIDHRTGPRRRGDELEHAIYEAALDELAEVGYAHLTMDQIAKRARTGKTSLYRRWPTRADLILDAMRHRPTRHLLIPDTGDLREDLLIWLRRLAKRLDGPFGETMRGLVGELPHQPETDRVMRERVIGLRTELLLEFLQRGVDRGQIRPESLTARVARTGPALVIQHFLMTGRPIPDEVIVEIVDEVVLPLLTGRA